MRLAILCREYCGLTLAVADYFASHDLPISLFIIETGKRSKLSAAERKIRNVHAAYDNYYQRGDYRNFPIVFKRRLDEISMRLPATLRKLTKPFVHLLYHKNHVPTYCRVHRIPAFKVDKHSSQKTREYLEGHGIAYALLTTSGWLIKEPLLSMPKVKIINAHYAKLPQHRGLDALGWSILENDPVGLTTHFIDAGIDTGPILFFQEIPLQVDDSLSSLYQRLQQQKTEVFYKTICGLRDGTIRPILQEPEQGILHRPLSLDELLQADDKLRSKNAALSDN